MEKPVERTTAAAAAIVDSCASADMKLAIVFQHRFRDASLVECPQHLVSRHSEKKVYDSQNVTEFGAHSDRESNVVDIPLALRTQLKAGELGDMHAVQLAVPWWSPQSYYDEPGRGSYERDSGGVLIGQAAHGLDLMLSLTGAVNEVSATAGTTGLHRMESKKIVGADLRFDNGGRQALNVHRLIDALMQSANEQRHIKLEELS